MARPVVADTPGIRTALSASIIDLLRLDRHAKLNYDNIRPENMRHINDALVYPDVAEPYTAFGATLLKEYDIQLNPQAFPAITTRAQIPAGHEFPESSELWFRTQLIKLHCFHEGTISDAVAETFLPPELRGVQTARTKAYLDKLKKSKDYMRKQLITDTLLPLVLFWCKDASFATTRMEIAAERLKFFVARIKDDLSVIPWWLRPLAAVYNLQFLYQKQTPTDPEEARIRSSCCAYNVGRMAWTADLIYRNLIDHDPANGNGFFLRGSFVTAGLQKLKSLKSISPHFVNIRQWPSFETIQKGRVKDAGEVVD